MAVVSIGGARHIAAGGGGVVTVAACWTCLDIEVVTARIVHKYAVVAAAEVVGLAWAWVVVAVACMVVDC